jgi:hypothetical protein
MSESRLVDGRLEISRRTLLAATAAFAVPAAVRGESVNHDATQEARVPQASSTWPHGARLAVSFSLMFEAGGQPISGAGGVIPDPSSRAAPTCRPILSSSTESTKESLGSSTCLTNTASRCRRS